jgi:hypothetical protein
VVRLKAPVKLLVCQSLQDVSNLGIVNNTFRLLTKTEYGTANLFVFVDNYR